MFWDVAYLLKINGCLRGMCCLHLQERRKGGSNMFHCNIDKRLSDYTVISQRTVFFVPTAMGTSDLTQSNFSSELNSG
jgi:hypothetical protein